MPDIGVADPNIEVKTIGNGVTNDNIGVKTKPIGVKMKPIKIRMKPIGAANPGIGVKMNATLHSDPDALVKMPDIVHPDPDADVKTSDNEVGMKPIGQKRAGRFVWRSECSGNPKKKRVLRSLIRWLRVSGSASDSPLPGSSSSAMPDFC
ncbi:MAG: hypothetical protein JNL03_00310 [Prolixibacteraceae bacterium]|nr:hypothetical protein [Prolixibacteraceae bacterium]